LERSGRGVFEVQTGTCPKKARKFTENRIQPAFSDQDPNRAPPHNKAKRTECGMQQSIQQLPGQK
jgi:hypothetical protein